MYFWSYTNQHVLYLQDKEGDENWGEAIFQRPSRQRRDQGFPTPLPKVNAQLEAASYRFPSEILVGLNNRDPRFHDIYRINIETGERKLVQENKEMFFGYVTDEDYKIRFASRLTDSGDRELLEPDGNGGWKPFLRFRWLTV